MQSLFLPVVNRHAWILQVQISRHLAWISEYNDYISWKRATVDIEKPILSANAGVKDILEELAANERDEGNLARSLLVCYTVQKNHVD